MPLSNDANTKQERKVRLSRESSVAAALRDRFPSVIFRKGSYLFNQGRVHLSQRLAAVFCLGDKVHKPRILAVGSAFKVWGIAEEGLADASVFQPSLAIWSTESVECAAMHCIQALLVVCKRPLFHATIGPYQRDRLLACLGLQSGKGWGKGDNEV